MKTRTLTALLLSLVSPLLSAEPAEWVDLFDGTSLDGWVQRGGEATYTVEDGVIVGTTVPRTPNSFLCTEKEYGDFILELEFQVDPTLNCGVQIRSESRADYKDGRVHGYQVEIDPSDRAWSGGIYDEARRGWLDDHQGNMAARYAFRQGEWNHFRVEAIGPRLVTFLNGVPAADLVDAMTLRGFIALQVHGIGNREETLQVRYRNIRIQDLGESTWRPLFNGSDLSGWTPTVEKTWSVVDGRLVGKSPASEKRHSILLHEGTFSDFTIRTRYLATAGNSGFYFRAQPVDAPVAVHGFQAEIDANGTNAGGLYETGGRAWVTKPEEAAAKAYLPEEWNTMDISAHEDRVTVHLNGTKTAELFHDPGRREGRIGPQLHGGQEMDVAFERIDVLATETEYRTPGPWPSPDPMPDELVPEGAAFRLLADGFTFTEGPALGPDGRIYFNDIPNERTHVHDPETGETTVYRENTGRANGLFFTAPGRLVACEGGARRVTLLEDGEVTQVLADSFEGRKLNSPNDVVPDGIGGIYFTDPRYGNRDDMEMEIEGVYYLDRRGKLTRVIDDLVRPNGLILSPHEDVLYVADQAGGKIIAYDVAGPGQLTSKREFAQVGSDGMSMDIHGNVYCTWKGEVIVFAPTGEELVRVKPPEAPANCLLVGKTLYVTARKGFYAIDWAVPGVLQP